MICRRPSPLNCPRRRLQAAILRTTSICHHQVRVGNIFDNDRIECAYSAQGYDNCYAARGDLIFEWSHGKSEAALANDRTQCVNNQRQAYFNCLLARGDLTQIGQQPSSVSYDSSTRGYCTRISHDQRSFYGCMELGRRRSVRSCMDETGMNAGIPVTPTMNARYMQCMAKEGFPVAGPPDEKCTSLDVLLSPVPDKCFAYFFGRTARPLKGDAKNRSFKSNGPIQPSPRHPRCAM